MEARKRWLALTVAGLVAAFLMAGCSSKDIDKRFFVVSLGMDGGAGGKVLVSLKLAIPKGVIRHGDSEFIMMTMEDNTVENAVNRIRTLLDKELDFGHLKLVVFGEGLARQGIMPYMDWLERTPQIQRICWLAVGKPSALKVLEFRPMSERYPSNNIFLSLARSGTESDLAVTQYLYSFSRELSERGVDPKLPVIEVAKQGLAIDHLVLFRGDKLSLHLTPDETRIMNIIHGQKNRTEWMVGSEEDAPAGRAVLYSRQHQADFRILEGAEPAARIGIRIKAGLGEIVPRGTLNPERKAALVRQAEEKISKETLALLEKCRKAGIDPLGMGLRYRATHWNNETEWTEWQALYPALKFEVKTEVRITATGNTK